MIAEAKRSRLRSSPFLKELAERQEYSRQVLKPLEPPDLTEVQRQSYQWFLEKGLRELLRAFSPIEDYTGTLVLEFLDYRIDPPKPDLHCASCLQGACHQHKYFSPDACKERGLTYEAPLRAKVRLVDKETGEVKEWGDVYLGELPLMTPQGTFIINGTERVVVSQLNRSSGVYFSSRIHELTGKELFLAQIVARDGNWVEVETVVEAKQEEKAKERTVLRVRIGGSRAMPLTLLLKAFSGLKETRGIAPKVKIVKKDDPALLGKRLAEVLVDANTGEILGEENAIVTKEMKERLTNAAVEEVKVLDEVVTCGTAADIVRLFSVAEVYSQPLTEDPSVVEDQKLWLVDDLIDPKSRKPLIKAPARVTAEVLEKINAYLASGLGRVTLYRCDPYISDTLEVETTLDERIALLTIQKNLRPNEPAHIEEAKALIHNLFLDPRRYDLGPVGRYLLNRKLGFSDWLGDEPPRDRVTLTLEDLVGVARALILFREKTEALDERSGRPFWGIFRGSENGVDLNIPAILRKADWWSLVPDDVDHLKNKRVRSVGELLQSQLRVAFLRMERAIKERMATVARDQLVPNLLISIKPIQAAVRSFFASGQLSQFMSQHNPLDELEHKRRMTSLGPGGISRDSAKGMLQLRDVHPTHYGRICPIQTPEGPNIGLISHIASYARIDEYGFLTSPYRVVKNGRVTGQIVWLAPDEDERYFIAPADTPVNEKGQIILERLIVRGPKAETGEHGYLWVNRDQVQFMDATPLQCFSVATNLIPFLEHDDANRALMGSNMQRQAVPLLRPEPPLVQTGMEEKAARGSGALVIAEEDGRVRRLDASFIELETKDGIKRYPLRTFGRSNQGTCWHQRPLVRQGQTVLKGDVLADGPATQKGQLALGKNLLVAFMVWEGYNYEDAIVVSQRLVEEDILTSVHIEAYEVTARDTKLGPEEITRDVPNLSEDQLRYLDENGIIVVGAEVRSDDILVGKAVPKASSELSPEDKLMVAIFGKKAEDMKDASLRVPPGEWGTVIGATVLARYKYRCKKCSEIVRHWKRLERLVHSRCQGTLEAIGGDDLKSGVNMMVRVYVAQRRKISVGDKMAGRHGNKGVVSKILPTADMPYLPDGTPVDVLLSPLGVPSRMNIGQLLETHLGWLAHYYGTPIAVPPFQSLVTAENIWDGFNEAVMELTKETLYQLATTEWGLKPRRPRAGESAEEYAQQIGSLMMGLTGKARETLFAQLALSDDATLEQTQERIVERAQKRIGMDPKTGKTVLYDGRTGEPFDQPVTVGYMYLMKLIHLVEDKIHARATGPYSLVTQQPLGGKAQFGGQRLGEMEVWALEAYGAAHNLQEMLTVKSDDVMGRVQTFEDIAHGRNVLEPGIPESFKILIKELQSLGLQVSVETREGTPVELKDEEEELIPREGR
ncbi:MAG: DNA-directed RNA polymerase subunit beta [Armatimonadetes bacterium]|nr:DNA-directed RNA polymerase subunit beta [Armatimonadota bacterium]MDW8122860.1 DNA-directed RNA polymerase subunit beta [Armatimonadota bacterium]